MNKQVRVEVNDPSAIEALARQMDHAGNPERGIQDAIDGAWKRGFVAAREQAVELLGKYWGNGKSLMISEIENMGPRT